MKKIFVCFFMFFSIITIFSQSMEIVHTFRFGEPFGLNRNWDRVEGVPEGPNAIYFQDNNLIIPDSTPPGQWRIFDEKSFVEISNILKPSHGFSISPLNSLAKGSRNKLFNLYLRRDRFPTKYSYAIDNSNIQERDQISFDYKFFLTENFLFAQTNNNELISWELLEDGRYTYRNVKETQEWLDSGVGEHIGYHIGPSKKHNFGDFRIANSGLYMGYLWRNLIFPEGEYKQISNLRDFEYIGGDSKGLSYYWGIGPLPIDYGKIFKDPNFQVMIAIVDTWTRKVTFRMLEPGSWTPPYDDDHNLLGTFPKAIHPNGDVYFFDADEEKQEYELKRLKNDWWEEMGVDQRKIARIRSNHIPLRNEESNDSGNNGYNFANEYVWVLDEGDSAIDESGTATKWIQVQKIDGRKGWIYETEVYWE